MSTFIPPSAQWIITARRLLADRARADGDAVRNEQMETFARLHAAGVADNSEFARGFYEGLFTAGVIQDCINGSAADAHGLRAGGDHPPAAAPGNVDDPDLMRRFVSEFGQASGSAAPLRVLLRFAEAWAVFACLQVSLRHPGNQGEASMFARAFAQELERYVSVSPSLRAIAARGWQ